MIFSFPRLFGALIVKRTLHKARLCAFSLIVSSAFLPGYSAAASEPALLVVGASWANGNLPLNEDMVGVWGGLNVGLGSYLDLGQALVKDSRLPGYVINEAVAGASTVYHHDCSLAGGTACSSAFWISYDQQFDRALRRVANPFVPGTYNAKFVFIAAGNDCMHSNNYDVPEIETSPCTVADINAYIDRSVALGQRALDLGITPIFSGYPLSSEVILSGPFSWFIDAATWDFMAALYEARLTAELPGAVFLDIWDGFEHIGDGMHPNDKTSRKAAGIIAQYIIEH